MKVIYTKDLKGQGRKGDIKEVSDGYAKNFLISKGYAVIANEENKKILEKTLAENKKEDELNKKKGHELKSKLEKEELVFKVKADDNGKVFGSVNAKQIEDKLKELGYSIDKNQIDNKKGIAKLGNTKVDVVLYKDIKASLNVRLEK